jgi:WD40 repeat protein
MYQHCHEPFPDVRAKGFKVPDGICRILEKGSQKKPEERYQTAAELMADLDVVLHAPEVSHTFDGKEAATKHPPNKTKASISFKSIMRGKGVMGKTAWALVIGVLAWGFIAALGHRREAAGANGQLVPVPSASEQYRAEKEIKDIFKADYAKQNAADRKALAQKLLDQGRDTNNDRAAKFVLFREARDLAAGTGDFQLAFKAVDEMAGAFVVDAMELKANALVTAAAKADTDERNVAVTRACLELTDQAIAAEQYLIPARLLPVADAAARKAQRVALHEDVQAKVRQVAELRADYDRRKSAAATLATNPNDPDANSAMGKSLCFIKGSWDSGLPMLARGSDAPLKSLAGKELAVPTSGTARLQLADGWWDLADRQGDLAKTNVQQHAVDWYARGWPQLAGLDRAKAESRIPDAMKQKLVAMPQNPPAAVSPLPGASSRVVDVLKLINVERDQLAGTWKRMDGALASTSARGLIQVPYHPPEEYDFRVVFSPGDDHGHGMNLILSKGPRMFIFTLSGQQFWDAFEYVKGKNGKTPDNPTHVMSAVRPVLGQKYTIEVRVRNDHVEAFLGGKPVTSYKTDYSDLSIDFKDLASVQPGTLGLGAYDAPATIYSAEVTEVAGSGSAGAGNRVVDLMPLINPTRDTIEGDWRLDAGTLSMSATGNWARIQIPFVPSEEYEWTVVAERTEEKGHGLVLGFVMGGNQSALVLDGFNRTASGLETLDGALGNSNPTTYRERILPAHQSVTIVLKVLKDRVSATYDGKTFIDWKGESRQLAVHGGWSVPNKKQLFIGAQTPIRITSMSVKDLATAQPSAQPTAHTDATGHRVIDLMPSIDPKADGLKGTWHRVAEKLRVDNVSEPPETLLRLPYLPEASQEYDFHVGFVLRRGAGDVRGFVSHGGKRFNFLTTVGGKYGLENIGGNGGDAWHNQTTGQATGGYARDIQHDLVIRVRAKSVDACLDGRRVMSYTGNYETLSENNDRKMPDDALGINAHWGDVDFGPIEVVEVKGAGTLLRPPLPGQPPVTSPPTGEDPRRQTPGLVRSLTTIGTLSSVQVAPGGRRLCFSTRNIVPQAATVIDLDTRNVIRSTDGTTAQLLPDGKRVVGESKDKWRIWDLETGKDLFVLGEHSYGDGVVSSDGSRLMTFPRGNVRTTTLYDLDTGAKIRELKDHAAQHPYAMSQLGKTFAARTADKYVHVWDAENGNELWNVLCDSGLDQVMFSLDGKRLLCGPHARGAAVGIYNTKTGALLAECGGWSGNSLSSVMSADGKYLVVGCDDTSVGLRLFRLDGDEKKLTATLMGWPASGRDIGEVNSVAFSADSRRILAGYRNGKVRLYDVITGQELASFDHGGQVLQVSYSSDGRYAVSGNDTTIRVWRLP